MYIFFVLNSDKWKITANNFLLVMEIHSFEEIPKNDNEFLINHFSYFIFALFLFGGYLAMSERSFIIVWRLFSLVIVFLCLILTSFISLILSSDILTLEKYIFPDSFCFFLTDFHRRKCYLVA